jgi:UDP-N-acetylglucosamine:LPS N-acetylglucosamine transferase
MTAPQGSDRDNGSGRAGKPVRVLAIASGGGHWTQLLRMRPAWEGCDVVYATTHADYEKGVYQGAPSGAGRARFYTFPDANMREKLRLAWQLAQVVYIVLKERPDVVISTGASAGYFALRLAKYLGKRTIWVDSIANAEELSLAGQKVRPFADLWLTQWPHLAGSTGNVPAPQYLGAVL